MTAGRRDATLGIIGCVLVTIALVVIWGARLDALERNPQRSIYVSGLGAEGEPTAFRQRLSRIRRQLCSLSPELQAESAALAAAPDPHRSVELQFGLVRRALKAAMAGHGLGTHDPDGHLLVLHASMHRS